MSDDGEASSRALRSVYHSVVKVYCVSTAPSYSLPWTMSRQTSSTSSGFVISGRRLVTNAHSVQYHSNVRVRRHGQPRKFAARVLHVGHECDLAVLTVDDDAFWEDLHALEFGDVPLMQSTVIVVGYPTGGDSISVTKGVVSRVDVCEYSHAGEHLLAVQIDAAINAGNSGGPALMGDRVVGVAFETMDDAENIGYVIPVPVVRHFLDDIERHGRYTGFCVLGISWQTIENDCLRDYNGMREQHHGVLINRVYPLADAASKLRPMDVLMRIDDTPVADDGTVVFRDSERIAFRYVVSSRFAGETCRVTVVRAGEELEFTVRLDNARYLVPLHLFDVRPSYFVYAGLVFTVLSRPFLLHEYGKAWSRKGPLRLCEYAFYGVPEEEGQQVVVLNQVLADDINVGYQDVVNTAVRKVDGTEVRNLAHLVELVERREGGRFLRVDLDRSKVVVVDRERADETHVQILDDNNISKDRSADLLAGPAAAAAGAGAGAGDGDGAEASAAGSPAPAAGHEGTGRENDDEMAAVTSAAVESDPRGAGEL